MNQSSSQSWCVSVVECASDEAMRALSRETARRCDGGDAMEMDRFISFLEKKNERWERALFSSGRQRLNETLKILGRLSAKCMCILWGCEAIAQEYMHVIYDDNAVSLTKTILACPSSI